MIFSVDDITQRVKTIIDNNINSEQLEEFEDPDTLSLNDIIHSKIEEAAKTVILLAPHRLLGKGKEVEPSIEQYDNFQNDSTPIKQQRYILSLQEDFLRIVAIKHKGSPFIITEVITEEQPQYKHIFSKYAGIAGNEDYPKAAFINNKNGRHLLICAQNIDITKSIEYFFYIPIPKITNNSIDIPEQLYNATTYYIAYLTAITLSNANIAAALLNNAYAQMEIQTNNK